MTEEAICEWFEGDDWQYDSGWSKVQPLIRCKDCKRNKSDKWVDCPITEMFGRTTDNYCSLAEPKEKP